MAVYLYMEVRDMKSALEAIKDRSSTRQYTEESLTKEELGKIVKAGLMAPTAANRQEVHFTVINGGAPILGEIQDEMLKTRPNADRSQSFYRDAPVVIILSAKEEFYWSAVDAGIAVENMSIAAEALGLGSLIIGCIKDAMLGEKRSYFADALKLPEGYRFQVAFAAGHKAASKEPHEFDEAKNVTYL